MVEKDFQKKFTEWARLHPEAVDVGGYELKMIKDGKPMAFDRVASHQIESLQAIKNQGLYHKITDLPVSWGGRMRFSAKKPFDCLFLKGTAYIVLLWYAPQQPKIMYWIDVDDYVKERDSSSRKSLTQARAIEISNKRILL